LEKKKNAYQLSREKTIVNSPGLDQRKVVLIKRERREGESKVGGGILNRWREIFSFEEADVDRRTAHGRDDGTKFVTRTGFMKGSLGKDESQVGWRIIGEGEFVVRVFKSLGRREP
jgi:hypothetical protein